ncbi:MAG: hypothetical protein JNL64_00040 [Blastocatellia bacterium]|nr:hypothetical protein [Blastocatellia bacterium]
MTQSAQSIKKRSANLVRTVGPKAADIERMKAAFIRYLTKNGGVVSAALARAGLSRRTAYDHYKADEEFASNWREALEVSRDDLFAEARRRAVEGDVVRSIDRNGNHVKQTRKSDTLLIYLMKNAEGQKKWRGRLIQAGNLAIAAVRTAGTELALTEEQILFIQESIVQELDNVSLI